MAAPTPPSDDPPPSNKRGETRGKPRVSSAGKPGKPARAARGKRAPGDGAPADVMPAGAVLHDPANWGALQRRLSTKPPDWSVVVAARAALRALPFAAQISGDKERAAVLSAGFRATAVSRLAAVYPNRKVESATAARFAAAATAARFAAAATAARFAATAAEAAATARFAAAVTAATAATAAAAAAAAAGAYAAGAYAASAVRDDLQRLNDGESPRDVMQAPLWSKERRAPDWADRASGDLFKALDRLGCHWQVWANWYADILAGRRRGEAWDQAFVDLDPADPLPWDDGPKAVNKSIAARLRKLKREEQGEQQEEKDEEEKTLTQRPSSYRFDWQGERLEAAPVTEPPFDPVLAGALAAELRQKGQEMRGRLVDNNADEVVQKAVERALALLETPVGAIAEGLLLSRFNTLAAHARAYADPASDRDRAIRAALDDFSTTLGNLVDCYPGIRAINANRLALAMQAEQAPQVEDELRTLSDLAQQSPAIADTARAALDAGRDEVDDLSDRIAREGNLARAADWIKVRGEAVSARLSDAVNFVSAVLVKAGSEVAGLHNETWQEIRKTLPRSAARGIGKGTERASEEIVATLGRLPAIALAYASFGPLGALAVLVPRLGAHKRKAEEIKKNVDKGIDAQP